MAKKGREIEGVLVDVDDVYREYLEKITPANGFTLPKGYVSHSQIECYMRCSMQYYWRYICAKETPPSIAMAMGSSTHKAVECTHHHLVDYQSPAPLEQVVASFSDAFDLNTLGVEKTAWEKEKILPGALKDAGIRLVSIYNEKFAPNVRPHVDQDGVRGIEKKFNTIVAGIPFVGYIDLIDTQATAVMSEAEQQALVQKGQEVPQAFRTAIVDFKTKTKSLSEEDVKGSFQLTVYSYVQGIPLVRYDQFLRQKQLQIKQLYGIRYPADYRWMETIITRVVQGISAGIFYPCDPTSWVCTPKWCGYYDICRGKR